MTGGSDIIDVALGAGHAGWRLDRALADALPTMSRERLKSLVKAGALDREGIERSAPIADAGLGPTEQP